MSEVRYTGKDGAVSVDGAAMSIREWSGKSTSVVADVTAAGDGGEATEHTRYKYEAKAQLLLPVAGVPNLFTPVGTRVAFVGKVAAPGVGTWSGYLRIMDAELSVPATGGEPAVYNVSFGNAYGSDAMVFTP